MSKARSADEVGAAILDTLTEMSLAEDGGVSRGQLEENAVRPEAFANIAVERYLQDHPGKELDDAGQLAAVDAGCKVLATETVDWMLEHGQLVESSPGMVRLGSKPLKIHAFGEADKPPRDYIPGTNRELDLWHGMRRVTPGRLALIQESIRELGDLREFFPVLLDTQGNVVDGRHRRAFDPEWPASRALVPAEARVAVATAANRSNSWDKEDWKRLLRHREHVSGRRDAVRVCVRLALLEDPSRSDRAIARLVGCSNATVGDVRSQLVQTDQIEQFVRSGGRGHTQGEIDPEPRIKPASPPRPSVLTDEKQAEVDQLVQRGATRAEIVSETGLKANTAQRAMEKARERSKTIAAGASEPEPAAEPEMSAPVESEILNEPESVPGRSSQWERLTAQWESLLAGIAELTREEQRDMANVILNGLEPYV